MYTALFHQFCLIAPISLSVTDYPYYTYYPYYRSALFL